MRQEHFVTGETDENLQTVNRLLRQPKEVRWHGGWFVTSGIVGFHFPFFVNFVAHCFIVDLWSVRNEHHDSR